MNILNAADLLGPMTDDPDIHPEYRRALIELSCDVIGVAIQDGGFEFIASEIDRRR